MNVEQASHEPENEPEGATESFCPQTAEDNSSDGMPREEQEGSRSHDSAADQCATAQSSTQLASSTVSTNQSAIASTEMTTSDTADACRSVEKQQDSIVASESGVQGGSDHG